MIPLVIIFTAIAAFTDLHRGKVYNACLAIGCMAGMAFKLHVFGLYALQSFLGACLMLACLVPLYLLKGLGGGDVKLLCALALLLSFKEALFICACAFVLTALYAALNRIKRLGLTFLGFSMGTKKYIRFAVPVWIGTMFTQLAI